MGSLYLLWWFDSAVQTVYICMYIHTYSMHCTRFTVQRTKSKCENRCRIPQWLRTECIIFSNEQREKARINYNYAVTAIEYSLGGNDSRNWTTIPEWFRWDLLVSAARKSADFGEKTTWLKTGSKHVSVNLGSHKSFRGGWGMRHSQMPPAEQRALVGANFTRCIKVSCTCLLVNRVLLLCIRQSELDSALPVTFYDDI